MVMGGVRVQSQRLLLLIWQGRHFSQVLRTMLGPRRGPTETLVRWMRQRVGRPGPMWVASIESIVGGDQEKVDREELAGGGAKTTGAEETDTEVPISEVAPHPDPGRQYVGWAGGVLQVQDDGGSSGAATVEAGGGVGDARTGLGDADSDRLSLAMKVEFGAEFSGSESRADVAPKDEPAGIAGGLDYGPMMRRAREIYAHLSAQASKASGSVVVAESSAGRSTRRVVQHPTTRSLGPML